MFQSVPRGKFIIYPLVMLVVSLRRDCIEPRKIAFSQYFRTLILKVIILSAVFVFVFVSVRSYPLVSDP